MRASERSSIRLKFDRSPSPVRLPDVARSCTIRRSLLNQQTRFGPLHYLFKCSQPAITLEQIPIAIMLCMMAGNK
jgi:hypothetical protein